VRVVAGSACEASRMCRKCLAWLGSAGRLVGALRIAGGETMMGRISLFCWAFTKSFIAETFHKEHTHEF